MCSKLDQGTSLQLLRASIAFIQQNISFLGSLSSVMRPICPSPPARCAVLCHAVLRCAALRTGVIG